MKNLVEEKLKVGFLDENGILPAMIMAINLRHNLCLRGGTGTGKTFLIKELAREAGVKLYTLNMTANTTVDEFKGKWHLKPKDGNGVVPHWIDGTLVKAMKEGNWLCIEEANFMPPELSSVLYPVMDFRREIILDEKDGEIIPAHENFRLFLTANWDYQGTMRFNDAIANRVNTWVDIKYLSVGMEARFLSDKTGVNLDVANKMAKFASAIRTNAKKSGFGDLSTRILEDWATFIKSGMQPLEAADYSVVPVLAYEESEKEIIRGYLNSIFNARKRGDDNDE